MPTPFNHLAVAVALLDHPALDAAAREHLRRARPAFLLGNTGPDFGTLSGLPREASHFFRVPMTDPSPAYLRLFGEHPELRRAGALEPDHAAFITGYISHLWLDQAWIASFFEPVFGPHVPRSTFRQRLIDHNLLRAHLDLQDLARLGPEVAELLRKAEPHGWLAFAADDDLRRWRDHLAEQLEPGGRPQTIRVFARRMGIPAERFAARLRSPSEMERAVFRHISVDRLEAFRRWSLDQLARLVGLYLTGRIERTESEVHHAFPLRPLAVPANGSAQ